MKLLNVLVPKSFILESRETKNRTVKDFNRLCMNDGIRASIGSIAVQKFVTALIKADLSTNPYVDEIRLTEGSTCLLFKLKNPIIPVMAIKDGKKYIFDDEIRRKLKEADPGLEITHIRMKIPNSMDNQPYIFAINANGGISTHPNSGDDHICYGTYGDRVKIGKLQISKIIDLLRIANLDSAFRNFRYSLPWSTIPHEDY